MSFSEALPLDNYISHLISAPVGSNHWRNGGVDRFVIEHARQRLTGDAGG